MTPYVDKNKKTYYSKFNMFSIKKPKTKNNLFNLEFPLKTELINSYNFFSEDNYFYYDKLENTPFKDELWFSIKELRKLTLRKTQVKNISNHFFVFKSTRKFAPILHKIDHYKNKRIKHVQTREKLAFHNALNEAIASVKIEGKNIEKETIKSLLKKKKTPQTKEEQMFLNNLNAIQKVKSKHIKNKMSLELLNEMYKDLAFNMDCYRLRKAEDEINIAGDSGNTIYFTAPHANFVQNELLNVFQFLNISKEHHPIIKAIIVYFWISYLRPFTCENEAIAKNLFYYSVLKDGYNIFSYLPLFNVINQTLKEYVMAFVYSNQDDSDLTYFIDYILERINKAFYLFFKAFEKERNILLKLKEIQKKLKLNSRQFTLLQSFHSDLIEKTFISKYEKENQVSSKTARNDLQELVKRNLLREDKQGIFVFYYPISENIERIF
ncbi:MAG: hypothetical protein WC157_01670 [Candidatus Paceibacterota bacterium]